MNKRYHTLRDTKHGWYVLDGHRMERVTQRMMGGDITFYLTRNAAKIVADSLNNQEDINMNERNPFLVNTRDNPLTTFFIFRRRTGSGFEPTGWQSARVPATEEGARSVLEAYVGGAHTRAGAYLVQSPLGAWTFLVEPPKPAPLSITVL